MMATIKLLQAKNASTGTISMSKRLMAIHEAFSSNTGPKPVPALVLPNGDVNKNSACSHNGTQLSNPNPCVTVPTKSYDDKAKVSCSNMSTPTMTSSSSASHSVTPSNPISPPPAPPPAQPVKHQKPNSLILQPHTNFHDYSNGLVKSSEDFSAVRLVQKPPSCPASTKEVQTLALSSLDSLESVQESGHSNVKHSNDCPFNVNNQVVCNKSSDPFSESSDDYLETSTSVPDHSKGN